MKQNEMIQKKKLYEIQLNKTKQYNIKLDKTNL